MNLRSRRREKIKRKTTEWNYICLAFQLYLLCPFLGDSIKHIRLLKAFISPTVNRHVYFYFTQCFFIYLIKNTLGNCTLRLSFFPPSFSSLENHQSSPFQLPIWCYKVSLVLAPTPASPYPSVRTSLPIANFHLDGPHGAEWGSKRSSEGTLNYFNFHAMNMKNEPGGMEKALFLQFLLSHLENWTLNSLNLNEQLWQI